MAGSRRQQIGSSSPDCAVRERVTRRALADEQIFSDTEHLPRLVLIVGPAPELDVVDSGGPASRERDDVVIFEEAGLSAAPVCSEVRAATAVTLPDCALDGCRNGPSSRW
jgi:hypothetical protein